MELPFAENAYVFNSHLAASFVVPESQSWSSVFGCAQCGVNHEAQHLSDGYKYLLNPILLKSPYQKP